MEIAGKKPNEVKLVVNGAGAAAIACTKMYINLGIKKENIVLCDSKGAVRNDREDLNEYKRLFATDRDIHSLEEAIAGADIFAGFSKGGVLTKDMVRKMADNPIIMALANPNPEIGYDDAKEVRPDALIATGRSDFPNQVNNVIGFPYIFRGALDTRASRINEEMKIAAVHAIADLAKEAVPTDILKAYNIDELHFGPEYIIPKALDPRLFKRVSVAVAKAAVKTDVARNKITDWELYEKELGKWL